MAGPGELTVKMSALCLLCLSLFPSFSLGRVVGKDEAGFAECNVFFPGRVPPEGFTEPFHVKICQQYNGEPRFATLYSTKDKIPLYSAFKYTGAARSEADESWLLEPQVGPLPPRRGCSQPRSPTDAREPPADAELRFFCA